MIRRHITQTILKYSKQYPIIAIVGPRQSGKTTLSKALFPKYKYISLENLDLRQKASSDPRGFLSDLGPYVILDEIQRVPELFSYLQEIVDINQSPAQYILTGSSQFLLIENITQSLAGRIITFKLYPFSFTELNRYHQTDTYESIYRIFHAKRKKISSKNLYKLLWKGLYPRLYDKKIDSYKWYENYILTYIERDIRLLLNIKNLRIFENFLKLCASQSGQLINFANLSNSLGVSLPTVKEWISILETSGIIFILQPYFENFSKRIIKTPKIYFADTGLLCHLLSIRNVDHLISHPLLGSIFETFIISESFKRFLNIGEIPPLYFWRDQVGNEIDLIIYNGNKGFPIEIKISQSFNLDFKNKIIKWLELKNNKAVKGSIIYCGDHILDKQDKIAIVPWYTL